MIKTISIILAIAITFQTAVVSDWSSAMPPRIERTDHRH